MPRICQRVAMPGGGVAIITTSSNVDPNDPCAYCGVRHAVLCDFPVHKGKDTKRYTCSRRLCKACTYAVGDRLDFCPPHAVSIIDAEIASRLAPLLLASDHMSHKVALDLVDQATLDLTVPFRRTNRGHGLEWYEYFTERAAMFEYEGGFERPEAERRALALAGEVPKSVDWRRGIVHGRAIRR